LRHARETGLGRRAGFSLAEALAALIIISLIIGAIFAFEVAAARLSARGMRQYQAETRAQSALRAIAQEMREGIAVSTAQTNLVEYTYPAKETGQEYFRVPLAVGYRIRYYLGDRSGTAQSGGTYLWRGDDSTGTMRPTVMLADKVASLTFAYSTPPGGTQPDMVTVTIGVKVRSQGRTQLQTHSAVVQLRNYWGLGRT